MGFSVRGRDGAWQPASFIAHAWSILWRKDAGRLFWEKTRAVCSSMGGFQGGDDEAAESGTVVFRHTYAIFDCRLTVGIILKYDTKVQQFFDIRKRKIDILAQRWTK